MTEENFFLESLDRSTSLVKKWGQLMTSRKLSVHKYLSVGGISVWDVMAVELSLYHLPGALTEGVNVARSINLFLKNLLRKIKYSLKSNDGFRKPAKRHLAPGNKILFLGFSWYLTRDVVMPIAKALYDDGEYLPVVLVTKESGIFNENLSWVYRVDELMGEKELLVAAYIKKIIRKKFKNLLSDAVFHEGLNLHLLPSWSKIRYSLWRVFHINAAFHLANIFALARSTIMISRPAAIVSIDVADPRTRIFMALGKLFHIPTIQVQAGPIDGGCVEWRFSNDDFILIQGEVFKKDLINHGVKSERVIVTGSPRYDGLSDSNYEEILLIKKRFNIPIENRLIVLASAYSAPVFDGIKTKELDRSDQILNEMKVAISNAIRLSKGISLIIKPHILEDVEETRRLMPPSNEIHFADKNEDIRLLIKACDACITFGSTATFDSLVLHKPTICPVFPGWVFSRFFQGAKGVYTPSNQQEIESLFLEIANKPFKFFSGHREKSSDEFLAKTVGENPDGAIQRIVEILKLKAVKVY